MNGGHAMRVFISLVIISLIVGGGMMLQVPNVSVKATWLWDAAKMNDEEITALLQQKKVNTVYVQIDSAIAFEDYAKFIETAQQMDITVYALDGSPIWEALHYDELHAWLENYHQQHPKRAFAGIHLDVEPYLSDLWEQDEAKAIENYQYLIDYATAKATEADLTLEVDIPFWFDERQYDNAFGTGNFAEWIIAKVDRVTIMAYRDTAEEIIEISKQEIAFGNVHNTPIIIGVETLQSDEGDNVSFTEEGERQMNRALKKVVKAYKHDPMFAGIAVHHVISWGSMGRDF